MRGQAGLWLVGPDAPLGGKRRGCKEHRVSAHCPTENRATASGSLLQLERSPSTDVPAPGVLICEFVLSNLYRNLQQECQWEIAPT